MNRKTAPVLHSAGLRSPWRKDFSALEPTILRAARYALQIVARNPQLHHRLADDDFLGALWALSLPLVDPAKLACLQAEWMRPDSPFGVGDEEGDEEGDDGDEDDDFAELELPPRLRRFGRRKQRSLLHDGVPGARMRVYLTERFRAIPDSLLKRLAAADTASATHPSIAILVECAGLDGIESRLLDFVEKREGLAPFRTFLRETGSESAREHIQCLAAALDFPAAEIQARLHRSSPLLTLNLLKKMHGNCDLEDFLQAGDLLDDLLALEPTSAESLLAAVVEPAASVECAVEDFPHLAREAARVQAVLGQATSKRSRGVNALFYGPPGSGKTQFASAIAQAAGLQAYQVKSADEEGDGLSRSGRLGACQLVLRLLKGRNDCVIVFDEVEDVFGSAESDLFALFGVRKRAGKEKGWMNRLLEDNPTPVIWITNDAESMDPAFLRRFLLPVAFTTPPKRVRRQMIERHLGGTAVAPEVLDELAADPVLAPAQYGAARRLLDFNSEGDAATIVREGVAATRRVLHGGAGPRLRRSATAFDAAYLNLAGGVSPARLVEALARNGRGTLCFYGLPGTGKTEFAQVLADALDRELVVKAASDLISPYVGETERRLAKLFNEIDTEHTVLLMDEVDSMLRDRQQARYSWETTMVNELLQQMERFHGIFIAATNLIDQFDPAALRRFDFKLQFRPLDRPQRRALFAREALGDAGRVGEIPPALAARLDSMEMLTAGDFANVVRQRGLLGETMSPEDFLRRLIMECRCKEGLHAVA